MLAHPTPYFPQNLIKHITLTVLHVALHSSYVRLKSSACIKMMWFHGWREKTKQNNKCARQRKIFFFKNKSEKHHFLILPDIVEFHRSTS